MLSTKESDETLNDIKLKRGHVSISFVYIESVIARIISLFFIEPAKRDEFIVDVFEDEYFNFGLKVKIFEKVVARMGKKFPIQKLHRLNKLRNIIIHSQIMAQAEKLTGSNIMIKLSEPEFKHAGTTKNIKATFEEYYELEAVIKDELSKLPGGEVTIITFRD